MGFWATRGLRGSTLEDLINLTNEYYMKKNLAVIQKISTPIKPVRIDRESRTITLAYFDKKSTIDYVGIVQGVPVCFDAKETKLKSLPIHHTHPHQIEFMQKFEEQNGVSFLLVNFSKEGRYFFLPFSVLSRYYEDSKNNGRKSIPLSAFKYEIFPQGAAHIHYLKVLKAYLEGETTT